jgi:hypothetical protein
MPKLPFRPRVAEFLDRLPQLVKLFGKWPTYVLILLSTLSTPFVVAGVYLLARH